VATQNTWVTHLVGWIWVAPSSLNPDTHPHPGAKGDRHLFFLFCRVGGVANVYLMDVDSADKEVSMRRPRIVVRNEETVRKLLAVAMNFGNIGALE